MQYMPIYYLRGKCEYMLPPRINNCDSTYKY